MKEEEGRGKGREGVRRIEGRRNREGRGAKRELRKRRRK